MRSLRCISLQKHGTRARDLIFLADFGSAPNILRQCESPNRPRRGHQRQRETLDRVSLKDVEGPGVERSPLVDSTTLAVAVPGNRRRACRYVCLRPCGDILKSRRLRFAPRMLPSALLPLRLCQFTALQRPGGEVLRIF